MSSSFSSSNSTLAEINAINTSSTIFIRTWCFSMIILGLVGHILNIYIFTRPVLRYNPCSRYFLASSVSGCLVLFVNFPIRLMQAGYSMNIVTQSALSCQMITLILFWARAQPSWFIVLASIDRFLCSSSSVRLRSWSNLAMSSRTIPLVSMLVLLAYFHVPIYHAVNIQQRLCFPIPGFYQKFFGVWNLIVFSVGPPVLMLLFGFFTIQHMRQSLRRVASNGNSNRTWNYRRHRKNTDRQLIQMLVVQCCLFTLTASPTSVQYIYSSIRENIFVSNLQQAKDNLFYTAAGFISLTGPCTSFYLFTLSSPLFCRELLRILPGRCPSYHGSTGHSHNNTTRQEK